MYSRADLYCPSPKALRISLSSPLANHFLNFTLSLSERAIFVNKSKKEGGGNSRHLDYLISDESESSRSLWHNRSRKDSKRQKESRICSFLCFARFQNPLVESVSMKVHMSFLHVISLGDRTKQCWQEDTTYFCTFTY